MEFACGFVYVPPLTNQKDVQRSRPNVIKQSALLPPINKVRPGFPPPPPPPSHSSPPRSTTEQRPPPPSPAPRSFSQRSRDVRREVGPYERESSETVVAAALSPSYMNTDVPEPRAASPNTKKALLPPCMRATSGSPSGFYYQNVPSSNDNSQSTVNDVPYYNMLPEGSGGETRPPPSSSTTSPGSGVAGSQKTAPPLPPKPSLARATPDYLVLLPTSASQRSHSSSRDSAIAGIVDRDSLPGNPNVILVNLGKLLSEENVHTTQGEPILCYHCGSALDSCYDNMVKTCYFCQSWDPTDPATEPQCPHDGVTDSLFLLNPNDAPLDPSDALLIFCIDVSGSMCITSQVLVDDKSLYRTRLQFVKDAVLLCVQRLCYKQPEMRVGLITFNNQVTMHGYGAVGSRFLCEAELIDSEYLKKAAFDFPSPPPLCRTKDCLQKAVLGLSESGSTALGPAALLAIAMASRQAGSKVIICTDGKANTDLGNLELEDGDAHTILSSTTFYQELGEYAANHGVTTSVLSIEGTDCRLDELGRLADRTGGKVLIASPQNLHCEFEKIIENKAIATHCSVTLIFPNFLCLRGEREAEHRGTREVGNVTPHMEITIQFGAKKQDPEVSLPATGSSVSIQLQLRYRRRDGREMLRVLTTERDVTNDSSAVLSSLSLAIIQLNSSQASAALAVRGRFQDARTEGDMQRLLIERALEHNCSAEEEQIYNNWVKTMEPIHGSIHNYTRRRSVVSDSQSLTDQGAALLYGMKHSNTNSGGLWSE